MAQQQYDPEPFRRLLLELLGRTGETYRRASLAAGLCGNAISRFMEGARPSKHDCVALADHFGVNPNDLLQAARYEPYTFFDPSLIPEGEMCREVRELYEQLQRIKDPKHRERVLRTMKALVNPYINKMNKNRK
jgi:hypothetical protein